MKQFPCHVYEGDDEIWHAEESCHDLYAINKVSNVHRKNGVVSFF